VLAARIVARGGLLALTLTLLLGWLAFREPDFSRTRIDNLEDLESELAALRATLRIPGMSAAIAEGERVVWSRGFGMAAKERGIPAGDDTIYHLASLTKPYASTVLLQLVQEGRLDLDAPVSQFGIAMTRKTPVKVWHLLSHTSDEPPGTHYRYDGNAFGRLTQVIERASGRPFARELANRIIRPLDAAWIHLVRDCRVGSIGVRCDALLDGVGRGPSSERYDASPRLDAAIGFRRSAAPICAGLVRAGAPRTPPRLALWSRSGIVLVDRQDSRSASDIRHPG
jgi:CubicO group peptidase (beta-lactamase class C family)